MAFKHLTETEFLSSEWIALLERRVKAAHAEVCRDPTQNASVIVRIDVRFDPHSGQPKMTSRTQRGGGDSKEVDMGVILDEQLVLAGTGIRAEEDPDQQEDPMPGLARYHRSPQMAGTGRR